jgi:hypothetical protein
MILKDAEIEVIIVVVTLLHGNKKQSHDYDPTTKSICCVRLKPRLGFATFAPPTSGKTSYTPGRYVKCVFNYLAPPHV